MRLGNFFAIVAVGMLLATTGSSAQSKGKAPVMTHVTRGTITSLDPDRLVIRQKGKDGKEMSFALDTHTARPARLALGDDVTVRYRTQNHENIATGVQQARRNKS
jgi:hypothetical protein